MKKMILAGFLLAAGTAVYAQAAATATAGSSKVSPAKKQLVEKILKLQQPNIEFLARSLSEGSARQLAQQVNVAMQRRVAPEKREALAKVMQADLDKFVAETVPSARQRAVALGPEILGADLEKNFTEDELKQIIAILESPANAKFLELGARSGRSLQEKLAPDINPKLQALEQTWAKRLQEAVQPSTEKAIPAPPAAPGPTAK
ncbi:MAG: hypothetical protein ACOVOX_01090 [Burkholderiaceae bacterium]